MPPEAEAPHPQGAEGSAVAGDSVADEERQALGRLIEAFPDSTVGEPAENDLKMCPTCGLLGHFEPEHEECVDCEVRSLQDDPEVSTSTWMPVDLVPVLDGDVVDQPPSILERTDGQATLYLRRTHNLVGEPEAGKGWLALRGCAGRLAVGERVVYFDFETTAPEIVGRLRSLGVLDTHIFGLFSYVRPQEPLDVDVTAIAPDATLAVIDGVTESMVLHGWDVRDNKDVAEFLKKLARPLADAGAAVLLIDHVTKDREGRGRWALGAQHKLAGTDVTYMLEAIRPFGRGMSGLSRLLVSKDRPGHVRAHSAGGRVVGDVRFTSEEDGLVTVEIVPTVEPEDGGFRPTVYMERVSRFLEAQAGQASLRLIRGAVSGRAEYIAEAARRLVVEGFATMADGPRGSVLYTSSKPFREDQ
jgi:hypothetical protein